MARKPQKPREGPTLQQRLFVFEYFQTKPLNAAKAYRKVYNCSAAAAATDGPRLLRNAHVAALVAEWQKKLEEKAETTIEEMDRELVCAAGFDPADTFDPETGATLPLHLWPERARRAIASWEEEGIFEEQKDETTGQKQRVQVGVLRKFKLHNKTEAKKLWYQRRGALVEKHEHSVNPAGAPPTDEEWEELARLRHEVRGSGKGKPDAG
jgi:phage terminase small subunit